MKVLCIGLDGCSFELISRFAREGLLPIFSKIMNEGFCDSLTSTIPPHTAPGWISSLTGVNPGKHGIYQFWDTQSPLYAGKFMGSNDIGVPLVWDILNSNGYTTGMINIPMTHPPKKVKGYMLTWPLSNTLRYCYPSDLIKEISAHQGQYIPDLLTMFNGDIEYVKEAIEITKKRVKTIKYLVENRDVDFLMSVFTEIDRVSHYYWKYMNNNETDEDLRNAIRSIYTETDKAIGEILSIVDEDTTLLIYSDHGFELGVLDFYVQTYLKQVGLLQLKLHSKDYTKKNDWFECEIDDEVYSVDWSKTIAYMSAPGSYGININLKGRQSNGIVELSEYDTVCRKVIDELAKVMNPISNRPIFREVVKSNSIYSGKYDIEAPDIILVPDYYGIMVHQKITDGELFNFKPEQSGMHSRSGIFLLYGKTIKNYKIMSPRDLRDIAPTILSLFGIKKPLYMEGESVFTRNKLKCVDVEMVKSFSNNNSYNEDEQDEIKERLKKLGYF